MISISRRPITTKVHGMLDYGAVGALALLPRVLRSSNAVSRFLMGAAAGSLAYSLVTRYDLGLVPLLPMPAHLTLDAGNALTILASPLLFRDEAPSTRMTLAAVGATEMAITLLSQRESK